MSAGAASSALLCSQPDLVLALGIVSAPSHHGRRMAQRHSWMRWPNVGHREGAAICGAFIVRSGGAPFGIATALQREKEAHGDMLLARGIAHNESRVRGPLLSLSAWLLHAARRLRHAKFIGKLDDDAYLHAPDLERLLRATEAQLGADASIYLGVHTWYHWYPALFDNSRHGWTFQQSHSAGRSCRREPVRRAMCGAAGCACVGPFAFAAGYLVVLSGGLVRSLARDGGGVAEEAARLRALDPASMLDKGGKPFTQVMEDVWLGSVLHRFPPPQPVKYVSLLGEKHATWYVDQWDFRLVRTALLYHVITKQLERFLALHAYVARPEHHCSLDFRLRCESTCTTRAASQASLETALAAGRGHRRACASGAAVADQWCVVGRARPKAACCGGGKASNTSCTAIYGSNSWPKPFQPAANAFHRFKPVERGGATTARERSPGREARRPRREGAGTRSLGW